MIIDFAYHTSQKFGHSCLYSVMHHVSYDEIFKKIIFCEFFSRDDTNHWWLVQTVPQVYPQRREHIPQETHKRWLPWPTSPLAFHSPASEWLQALCIQEYHTPDGERKKEFLRLCSFLLINQSINARDKMQNLCTCLSRNSRASFSMWPSYRLVVKLINPILDRPKSVSLMCPIEVIRRLLKNRPFFILFLYS